MGYYTRVTYILSIVKIRREIERERQREREKERERERERKRERERERKKRKREIIIKEKNKIVTKKCDGTKKCDIKT